MSFTRFCLRLAHRTVRWARSNIQMPFQLGAYHCRNIIKDCKDRMDNAAFEVFERTILSLPNGGLKVSLVLGVWLILKLGALMLLALLVFIRPRM